MIVSTIPLLLEGWVPGPNGSTTVFNLPQPSATPALALHLVASRPTEKMKSCNQKGMATYSGCGHFLHAFGVRVGALSLWSGVDKNWRSWGLVRACRLPRCTRTLKGSVRFLAPAGRHEPHNCLHLQDTMTIPTGYCFKPSTLFTESWIDQL